MKEIVKSYAKINLHLAVGGKRSDNFHSIQSIFAKIDLFDTIEIEANLSKNLNINVVGLENCLIKSEDTISKAVRLWCEKTKTNLDVKIKVTKNIPIQAGLGGGSSNAASTLLAINNMFTSIKLDNTELVNIALEVGSDVPFFLYDTTFAYVEGRGEIVIPLKNTFDYNICLVKPKDGVSTKGAFAKLDKIKRCEFKTQEELINIFDGGLEMWKNNFYNDFELVIKSNILKDLREDAASFSLMSGSGSTCYSVYNKNNNCYKKNSIYEKYKNKNNTFSCFFQNI